MAPDAAAYVHDAVAHLSRQGRAGTRAAALAGQVLLDFFNAGHSVDGEHQRLPGTLGRRFAPDPARVLARYLDARHDLLARLAELGQTPPADVRRRERVVLSAPDDEWLADRAVDRLYGWVVETWTADRRAAALLEAARFIRLNVVLPGREFDRIRAEIARKSRKARYARVDEHAPLLDVTRRDDVGWWLRRAKVLGSLPSASPGDQAGGQISCWERLAGVLEAAGSLRIGDDWQAWVAASDSLTAELAGGQHREGESPIPPLPPESAARDADPTHPVTRSAQTVTTESPGAEEPPQAAGRLREREKWILVELHELGAVCESRRQRRNDVAPRVDGNLSGPDLARYVRPLKAQGYVDTLAGPEGGLWLTPKGRSKAEQLKAGNGNR